MVDCPISIYDANTAEDIFSKDKSPLWGKTVWSKPNQAQSTYINTPRYIMEIYQSVTLSANLMLVNSISYLIKTSHPIKFITTLMNKYQCIKPVIKTIKESKSHYAKHGFRIKEMRIDWKFEPSHSELSLLKNCLNTVAKGKHVTEIERINCTIKERVNVT